MIAKLRYFIYHILNANAIINECIENDAKLRQDLRDNRNNTAYAAQITHEMNENHEAFKSAVTKRDFVFGLMVKHINATTCDVPARKWFRDAGLDRKEVDNLFSRIPWARVINFKPVQPGGFDPWEFAGLG